MTLAGALLLAFFSGSLAVELLRRGDVAGFRSADDPGSVLLGTLSLHGAVLVLGVAFIKLHAVSWGDLWTGVAGVRRGLWMGVAMLMAAAPVIIVLKLGSDFVLEKLGWSIDDQRAVKLLLNAATPWMKAYLGVFAVLIAPVAEEFLFRGVLFSAAKKMGWRVAGYVVVSLLFALMHGSTAILVPLFAFALALTWLYEKTEGLLAPVVMHAIFNAANIAILFLKTDR